LKKNVILAAALWISSLQLALAFPSWMGVYGSYIRHDGGNPGTFTILQNQNYSALRAEVGIKIGNGSWQLFPMVHSGTVSINSIWKFSPAQPFPANTPIKYYFHGFDSAGGNIWDNNSSQNYTFTTPGPVSVQWLGNISHWPPSGQIDPIDDFWINAESWPLAGGVAVSVVFTTNNWTTLQTASMSKAGKKGNNDWWNINLGKFFGGTIIDYAVLVTDALNKTIWNQNGGANYKATVNPGQSTIWVGNQSQWPINGSMTQNDDFWINVESWPTGTAFFARSLYSVNGGVWYLDPMRLAGKSGNNDWWHLNLQKYPPGATIFYTTEVTDQNGITKKSSSGFGRAVVNGATTDTDSDGLPDDWEIYWWGNLSAFAHGNADGDGANEIPLINSLEYRLGTEPIHSNAVSDIPFLWKPTHPVQRGIMRLSFEPRVNQLLPLTNILYRTIETPGNITSTRGPLLINHFSGRFETDILLSASATNVSFSFSSGNNTDNNHSVLWSVPVTPLSPHLQPDSDADGMPDAWETANQLDPLDHGSIRPALGPHGDPDGDGFDNLTEFQAGSNPRNARSTPDTIGDADLDGMPDFWEYIIIDHNTNDAIFRIDQVNPRDDYDGDGIYNIEEFERQSDPANSASRPPGAILVAPHASTNVHTTSIQQAVDLVADNGWVLLYPGEYEISAAVNTRGKRFILRGIGKPSDIIIKPVNSRAFTIDSGESPATIIEQLTVLRAASQHPGGAIYCHQSSPTLRNINFVQCFSIDVGGAVFSLRGSPRFEHVTFSNCTSYAGGGAIATESSTGLVINACSFTRNYAIGLNANGGALFLNDSHYKITSSYFLQNGADRRGGAGYFVSGAGTIDHCTLVRNISGFGLGSCFASSGGGHTVGNSILWASSIPELFGSITENRNFYENPDLVPGSFRLQNNSKCINSAIDPQARTDMDGELSAGLPDMGCDEFVDADQDLIADAWEREHIDLNPSAAPTSDSDNDNLTLIQEYNSGTHPLKSDTDGDGIPDGWEIAHGLNPLDPTDVHTTLSDDRFPALYEYHQSLSSVPAAIAASPSSTLTIQDQINAAAPFSIIELADGIYTGPGNSDLVLTGKNLMITSINGADSCVIDCGGQGRGITFSAGVDARTTLRGITIKNGNVNYTTGEGGAIRCVDSSPVIESCVIVSNRSEIGGGGIYLKNSGTVIRNTSIRNNIASYNRGGGITIVGGSPRIESSIVIENHAISSGHLGGGGIYAAGGEALLQNTIIANNRSERNGGGVFVGDSSRVEIFNCTTVSNRPQGVFASGDTTIQNSIIWGNGTDFINNNVTLTRPISFSVVGGLNASFGIINADPRLNLETLTLTASSPCIDAGSSMGAPDKDIHGEYRWDHPDKVDLVSSVDIGADEFVDLDLDELDDVTEYRIGSNPISTDSDLDGLSDGDEYFNHHTSPTERDSDGDGFTDHEEFLDGMDPLNPIDGRAQLESARRGLIGHWRVIFGDFPVFNHPAGSPDDLDQLDRYLEELSAAMVHEVYP